MDNTENTRPVCSCCGATIETDDYYTFEGSILCDDCYHSETDRKSTRLNSSH